MLKKALISNKNDRPLKFKPKSSLQLQLYIISGNYFFKNIIQIYILKK